MSTDSKQTRLFGPKNNAYTFFGACGLLFGLLASNYLIHASSGSVWMHVLFSLILCIVFACGVVTALMTAGRTAVYLDREAISVQASSGEGLCTIELSALESVRYTVTPTRNKYSNGPPHKYDITIRGTWGSMSLGDEIDEATAEPALARIRELCPPSVRFERVDVE